MKNKISRFIHLITQGEPTIDALRKSGLYDLPFEVILIELLKEKYNYDYNWDWITKSLIGESKNGE